MYASLLNCGAVGHEVAITTKNGGLHVYKGLVASLNVLAVSGCHTDRTPMQKNKTVEKLRHRPPTVRDSEQSLLALLEREASKRGDTLTQLAKALGVTYRRVAQWRRNEAQIKNAGRSVLEHAAGYLGLPTLVVLIHAESVKLTDFDWPDNPPKESQVASEIARMRQDPLVGPFVPESLAKAHPSVRRFVVFLFGENERGFGAGKSNARWLNELQTDMMANLTQSGKAASGVGRET